MTLRRHTLLIVGATLVGMTLGLYLVLSRILSSGFADLESRDMDLTMKRMVDQVGLELNGLVETAGHMAESDEAYAFARTVSSAYVTNHLAEAKLAAQRIHLLVWYDSAGRRFYDAALDRRQRLRMPVPTPITELLEAQTNRWRPGGEGGAIRRGVCVVPDGLLMVAARPILTSKRAGPPRGTLLAGRYLDISLLQAATQLTNLALKAWSAGEQRLPDDVRQAFQQMSATNPTCRRILDERRMAGYALVPFLDGSHTLVLQVELPRSIRAQGQKTFDYLLASLLVAGAVLCVVVLVLLDRLVLARLGRFSADVGRIGATGDASARVAVAGRDELARLGSDINAMLQALHEAQRELQGARDQLEERVKQRTGELEQSNRRLQDEIAERLKIEGALRQSEELFSTAFRTSPVSVSLSTYPEGRLLDVNEAFLRMFGYDRDEVLGLTALEMGLWAEPEERAGLMALLERDGGVRDHECRFRTKAGAIRNCLVSVEKMQVGTESCMLFIRHDITDRLNLESQLRHSQKMEAVGQMAASVAHDFNNILTVIRGHASLLLSMKSLEGRVGDSLAQVSAAAERATNLTRQLLTFSRKQVMQPKPLNLNEVLSNISKMVTRLMGESIVLQFHYAPKLPALRADAGMLEQVIMNLAVNARDAMPQGGKLTVATEFLEILPDQARHYRDGRAGRFVCMTFGDTGCGMDAKTLSRIFEPFFTTKAPGKGTGLGLATVYGIVKQHQGWIDVNSEVGKGTMFRVYLPCLPKPLEAPAEAPAPIEVRGGSETVLVVEDEDDVKDLVRGVLQHYGYRVLLAGTPEEAIDVWKQRGTEVDVLLTDMVLRENLSGKQLAQTFQQDRPPLRVIYTSGYTMEAVSQGLDLRDGLSFLQKPFSAETLAQAIRRSLDTLKR